VQLAVDITVLSMIEIKVTCGCGQKYKFDVEPLNGRMPFPVGCPSCGADGTPTANAILAQSAPQQAAPRPVEPAVAAPSPPRLRLVKQRAWPYACPPPSPSALRQQPGGKPVFIIRSPRFAILNLKGDAAAGIIAEDTAALLPVLGKAEQSASTVPRCDVLFVYCDLEPNGRIPNSANGLREIIRDSGAVVVVVASDNPGDAYVAFGGEKTTYGKANLVMTINRAGTGFSNFFAKLFADMNRGVSMPVAYVKLAPQYPPEFQGDVPSDLPGTLFVCEAGQVAFN
jgi:hypothetical protein